MRPACIPAGILSVLLSIGCGGSELADDAGGDAGASADGAGPADAATPAADAAPADELPTCLRTIPVDTTDTLQAAADAAEPGDCILLADGDYGGVRIARSGTADHPIVVAAEHRGLAVIASGFVHLDDVAYVVVVGLTITGSGGELDIAGTARPVGVVLVSCEHCRVTRSTFRMVGAPTGAKWLMIADDSDDNRVDHCEFGPFTESRNNVFLWPAGRQTIDGVTLPDDRTAWANGDGPFNPNISRHTRIDHDYFHDKASGSSETIVLGGAGRAGDYQDTYSIVEDNLFENCDGDAEIISVKASSTTIRYNTIRTSSGMLSLRAGNRSAIHGNFLLQGGKPGAGGIKLYEMDHVIYNNYIAGTGEYPILVGGGDAYAAAGFAHAQVRRAQIVHNTLVDLDSRPVRISHGGSLPPAGCLVADNILTGGGDQLIIEAATPIDMTYRGNLVWPTGGGEVGLSRPADQFRVVEPGLALDGELWKLGARSPAIDAASQSYPFVVDDADGQPRATPDIGADERSAAPTLRRPLTAADVGPDAP